MLAKVLNEKGCNELCKAICLRVVEDYIIAKVEYEKTGSKSAHRIYTDSKKFILHGAFKGLSGGMNPVKVMENLNLRVEEILEKEKIKK